MKYLKMFGLAVLAATALMAFVGAGSASATGIACSTATNPCSSPWATGTAIDFSLESGSSAHLETTTGFTVDTCTSSTVKGKLVTNSGGVATGEGPNASEISWGGCTWTTTTLTAPNKLKIEAEDDSGNAEIFADSEIEVTIAVSNFFGGACIYRIPSGTTLGTFKESTQKFTANAVAEKTTGLANHPCNVGSTTALWTATYVKTEPSATTLYVSTS